MSAPIRRIKMAAGKVGSGKIKNSTAPDTGGSNTPQPIKNAVGMQCVGGQGYARIKGAVSG